MPFIACPCLTRVDSCEQQVRYFGALIFVAATSSRLWTEELSIFNPCKYSCPINKEINAPVISFSLEQFCSPIGTLHCIVNFSQVFPSGIPPQHLIDSYLEFEKKQQEKMKISIEEATIEANRLLLCDALTIYTEQEKWLLWSLRDKLRENPFALPKILQATPFQHPYAVYLAQKLLVQAKKPYPLSGMEMLSFHMADLEVRRYAVQLLSQVSDAQLEVYLLQLVQALKFELYHDCPLARFLLQRGLRASHSLGHILFWHLKAELHDPHVRERHGLILEEYLRTCGSHRRELLKQNGVVEQLLAIAMKIKKTKKDEQLKVLQQELKTIKHPPKFVLPLSPRLEVTGFLPDKCKVMDSKKYVNLLVQ